MQTIHFIASTTLVLLFVVSASAQNSGAVGEWRTLNVPELGLSLNVPADFAFAMNIYERDPGSDQKKSRGEFQSNDERFFIFVDSDGKKEQFKVVTKFIAENIGEDKKKAFLKNETGRVEFADKDGYYHRVRFFKTMSKMITLQTVSTDKESKLAERFLNSIEFDKSKHPIHDKDKEAITGAENSRQSGTAYPSSDHGSMDPRSRQMPKAVRPPAGAFQVKSKPRAAYTDFARFYNIQGIVRVRVTFDADGKIGAVNVVKKLPFGLVDESIKAARKIKFKPKEQDGKPITIVKPVEYSFTIY